MKKNYIKSILPAMLALILSGNVATAQRIAAGGWHSVVICNDGTVKAFGENATGQLGYGTVVDQSTPVPVAGLTNIIAVSAGGDQLEAHSMALKSDGTVWSWGSNIYGGLGSGTTTNSSAPVQATGLGNVTAIAAGGWHSAALKNDGTVWTWGWNTDGQLGDGTTANKSTPVQVPGLSGVTQIAAGTYHMVVLKNDGTVWTWGDNISGQIGDGTTATDKTSPVQVTGLSGVLMVAAGRFFSLAVKSDGTVWTWGENLYGQLGNGTTTDSPVPVQVSGLSGVTSATAATGAFHCMAEKSDNTVWAWGRNTYGNLGDNTVVNKSTPVQMTGISGAAGLAAGTNFSLLFKTDGTFWGCGRNASGQLGDGTVVQRNTLTQSALVCSIKPPAGIETVAGSEAMVATAYPNPSADGKFTIEFSDITHQLSDSKLEVYDMVGKKVLQMPIDKHNINAPMLIDLTGQAAGVYILSVSAGSERIYQKLFKQ